MDSKKQAYIAVNSSGSFTLNSSFTEAIFSLSKNELKAWLTFVADIERYTEHNGDIIYTFDAVKFADRLGIDKRKARGSEVAKIFRNLNKKTIEADSSQIINGEHGMITIGFISYSLYDPKSHLMKVSISELMNNFLFEVRQASLLFLEVEDIVALETLVAMRVFIFLKDKERTGLHSISIESFRTAMNFFPTAPYKEYKRRVLKEAVKEIRRRTIYKNFFIEDDGTRGRKANTILFGFDTLPTLDDGILPEIESRLSSKLRSQFSKPVLIAMTVSLQFGFNPLYIKDKFDNIPDEQIIDNFHFVMDKVNREKRQGKDRGTDVYGRFFIPAVLEDWASGKKSANTETRELVFKATQGAKLQQEQEDMHRSMEKAMNYSQGYIDKMPVPTLLEFINKHSAELKALAGRNDFNCDKAMSRNKRYREYKILRNFIAGGIMQGTIKTETVESMTLF